MSTNPFHGLISNDIKQDFRNAINELIRGCELPCKIYYPPTKFTTCTNCQSTEVGKRGPNPFNPGGSGKHVGLCSVCNGARKIPVENSESINLIVLWDYNRFEELASLLKSPDGTVQTFCKIGLIEKIKRAEYVVFNIDIQAYAIHEFVRDSEPSPCGFGSDDYIMTTWKKQT